MNSYVEEGTINWIRDLDEAFALAAQESKPIFLLFQEIPGCSTCTKFGRNVLSNKEIVSLVHEQFVPCLVNNTGRSESDRKALSQFREPTWNNPVVRFINSDGDDVIPRRSGVYTKFELLQRCQQVLEHY